MVAGLPLGSADLGRPTNTLSNVSRAGGAMFIGNSWPATTVAWQVTRRCAGSTWPPCFVEIAGTHSDRELPRRFLSGVFEREMAGTHVLCGHQRRSVPLPDNPAAIKDREPVSDGGADRQTLLDEQHG